jgi:DNA-binding response OmpR family regulator
MVVDDEPDVRAIIAATLRTEYEVCEAHDGLDALEKLERYEPDFVLMDVMMPMMDGFEACAAIRKNARFHDLPVMFLTALTSKDDIKKGYGAGANLYLTKPFEPSRLLKNIEVFFRTNNPARTSKRYTIEQLHAFEADKDRVPVAPGSTDLTSLAEAEAAPKPVVHLPAPPSAGALDDTARTQPAPTAPVHDGPVPRIMVVDDDPDIIQLMDVTLCQVAEVVKAGDGIEAIERLVKYQPDILVIDIMLPKMSGFQLIQSLRSNKAFARLPIMVCSAKSAERDKQFAARVGANEYLVKPFAPGDLIEKIRRLIMLPDFRVRPKTYSMEKIVEMESSHARPDVFATDDEVRASEVAGSKREMNAFLKTHQAGSGTEREAPKEDDGAKKKIRRIFGFGRKG